MQLHFTPLSVPWHSGGENSELSMQWGHISRHYSTDRSSSIGSMESLENPPNQGYYDNQLSPIDPVIFNNKRDSAYSSFSASSNTSDYTVPVKPEESNSMDSFLQGQGSSCRYPDGGQHSAVSGHGNQQEEHECSKMLSDRAEVKVRPLSYGCEEEHCMPPQPPMRKDSFRATRGQSTDKRCVSAPVGIPSVSSGVENQPHMQDVVTGDVYLNGTQDKELDNKGCTIEPYYTFNSQKDTGGDGKTTGRDKNCFENCSSVVTSSPPTNPFSQRNRNENFDSQLQPEHDVQSAMHRHSAPEKLLASQLHMMDFSDNKCDHHASPSSQWSQSPLYTDTSANMPQGRWGASRCSTPGSLANSEIEDPRLDEEPLESEQNLWGQPVSVSGNSIGNGFSTTNSQINEKNFGSINTAVSVDTHLNENGGEVRVGDDITTKQLQKRQFRTSKSRRRSERFATNLRNEIQRKKAQLQKSRSPCGEETVEEEVADVSPEAAAPPEYNQPRLQTIPIPLTNPPYACVQISKQIPQVLDATQAEEHPRTTIMCFQTSPTQTQIPQHARQVCVHVVEEKAPAGKPRRWRWTPERKLQPESETSESKRNEATGQVWSGKMGSTRGRTTSSHGRFGRSDECDIMPFADRRRFFEETSRKLSQSVTNLSSLTCRNQRPDKPGRTNHPSSPELCEMAPNLGRRRFSYQDVPYMNSLDTRRLCMSSQQDQEKVMERLIEREQEKERELERERVKEQEKLREQEREKELLRVQKERAQQRLKDREEKQRLLQREREWESERETVRSEHNMSSDMLPQSLSRKQPPSTQVPSSLQSSEHFYSNINTNIPKPCSAFHPVTAPHNQYDQYGYHADPPYKARSYTPNEASVAKQPGQTKHLNRNYSLTERDYPRCRRDSKTGEGAVVPGFMGQGGNQTAGGRTEEHIFSPLRNRAMSENDIRVETSTFYNHNSNNSVSRIRASTLSDLDENRVCGSEVKKKKGPPPPRPPPPKWDQFHKRRASHHNLFSCPPLYSSPSSSPPRSQPCTSCPPSVPEMTRQRSYSLPPRDVSETHHRFSQENSVAPPSSAFTHRAFKPVALPPRERDSTLPNYDIRREFHQPVPQSEPCLRIPAAESDEPGVTLVKPVFPVRRGELEQSGSYCPGQGTARSLEVPKNSLSSGPVCPESYFSMNNYHLQHHQTGFRGAAHKNQIICSRSPSSVVDENLPLETDIDEICENERAGEVARREGEDRMEMQGFARPVMVLETDIDNMPEEGDPSARNIRGQRSSLVESILEDDYGLSRKELIGELFPHSVNADVAGESWRGGFPISGGTLERSSRLGTSTAQISRSTCYEAFTDNTQLLAKIREISEKKEEEEELHYKKQLMESLCKKLSVLREAQRGLQEDIRANAQLGEEVERLVLAICKPNEVDKYRMFIGDLDKVTSLLLSLSGRLIRVESALDCVDPETGHHERLQLLEKKKQLLVQMAEAQELKEHVDRREQAVGRVLGCCLTPEQMRDYSHFVKMKAALLVEQRQLDDKIRLGEEQLRGLRESLTLGYGHY